MNKAYHLYVVYADCGKNAAGFEPRVFRMDFPDAGALKEWLKDSNNLKAVIILHAELSGVKPGAVFLKAVYVDSETCEELGFPNDGTKLEDVVSCLFKRWFSMKRENGFFFPAI